MNVTNKCEHKFIKIVSAHFVTNENCYADYHWCKKCGTVKAVKTYDESFIENWVPDSARGNDVSKEDDSYDYYDGPEI